MCVSTGGSLCLLSIPIRSSELHSTRSAFSTGGVGGAAAVEEPDVACSLGWGRNFFLFCASRLEALSAYSQFPYDHQHHIQRDPLYILEVLVELLLLKKLMRPAPWTGAKTFEHCRDPLKALRRGTRCQAVVMVQRMTLVDHVFCETRRMGPTWAWRSV